MHWVSSHPTWNLVLLSPSLPRLLLPLINKRLHQPLQIRILPRQQQHIRAIHSGATSMVRKRLQINSDIFCVRASVTPLFAQDGDM